MNTENTTLSVGGYRFFTEKDARLAQAEQQKIEYLEARIDYSAPESIRYIYEQTIQERLYMTFDGELRDHGNPARERVTPSKKEKEKEKNRFTLSVILNVLLVMAICAMFYISFVSEQPNIVNYERALTSKYASWEQELTQREELIREKERELKINADGN